MSDIASGIFVTVFGGLLVCAIWYAIQRRIEKKRAEKEAAKEAARKVGGGVGQVMRADTLKLKRRLDRERNKEKND